MSLTIDKILKAKAVMEELDKVNESEAMYVQVKRPENYSEAVNFLKITGNEEWLTKGFSVDGYSVLATAQNLWDKMGAK